MLRIDTHQFLRNVWSDSCFIFAYVTILLAPIKETNQMLFQQTSRRNECLFILSVGLDPCLLKQHRVSFATLILQTPQNPVQFEYADTTDY